MPKIKWNLIKINLQTITKNIENLRKYGIIEQSKNIHKTIKTSDFKIEKTKTKRKMKNRKQ